MDITALAQRVVGLHHSADDPFGAANSVLGASSDIEAVAMWLAEFDGATRRHYRKEAERFLMWLAWHEVERLEAVTRRDISAYQAFVALPPEQWVGPRRARQHPQWRPFSGPLSAASQRQVFITLNAMFAYLVAARYLAANPVALIRRHRRGRGRHEQIMERFLDRETWGLVWRHVCDLPVETKRQRDHHERYRFLFAMLYLLAPRVSEVASQQMNSFRRYKGRWWWFVSGKGGKQARVPVNDDMLAALARYRQYLGLSPLPVSDDDSPLLRSVTGKQGVTANMVYRLVKQLFAEVAATVDDPHQQHLLTQASTHWMRHTAITHADEAGVSLKHLSKSARHEKLETTAIYQHAEEDLWHQSWEQLRLESQ